MNELAVARVCICLCGRECGCVSECINYRQCDPIKQNFAIWAKKSLRKFFNSFLGKFLYTAIVIGQFLSRFGDFLFKSSGHTDYRQSNKRERAGGVLQLDKPP